MRALPGGWRRCWGCRRPKQPPCCPKPGRGDAAGIDAGNAAHLLARLRRPLPALRMAGRDGAANRSSVHPTPIRAIPPPQRVLDGRANQRGG
ncbi:MAG: hypothetical protein H6668_25505 [Ardenticatenaceae bacterium]|nr:hypothetical protein [Ardenticatenaceae bacterium]